MNHQPNIDPKVIERLIVNEFGKSPRDRYTRAAHSFRKDASERLAERLRVRHQQTLDEQAADDVGLDEQVEHQQARRIG